MQDSMQYAYGAGNDLARCLNWGGGLAALREQGLPAALAQIEQATPSLLDRWQVAIQPRPPQPISDPSQRHKRTRSLQQRAESAIHSIQPQPKVSFLPESLHRSFALFLTGIWLCCKIKSSMCAPECQDCRLRMWLSLMPLDSVQLLFFVCETGFVKSSTKKPGSH